MASPSILAGRMFDERGNRMTPTHTNKRGVRYRYYVSHAVLQKCKTELGGVTRVPAPEIEALVLDGVRKYFASAGEVDRAMTDRDLIECHIEQVVIKSQAVEVRLISPSDATAQRDAGSGAGHVGQPWTTITLPGASPSFAAVKGIVHTPLAKPTVSPETREALLSAIAKARLWSDEIRLGRIASFAEIAEREGLGERHVRLLAPLAFVSPSVIAAIIEGSAPADLTVTRLAKALPYSWAEQERRIGLAR